MGVLTAILHRGLWNDFFFRFFFSTNLLFPIFIWTFISPFQFGLLFPFSIWTLFNSFFYLFLFINSFFYIPFYHIAVWFWIYSIFFLFFKSGRASPRFWFCSGFYTCIKTVFQFLLLKFTLSHNAIFFNFEFYVVLVYELSIILCYVSVIIRLFRNFFSKVLALFNFFIFFFSKLSHFLLGS